MVLLLRYEVTKL